MEDAELLQEYVERRAEAAFTALVARHINLVYSTARRMVGDAHLAQDVAQTVFIGLARAPTKVRQPAALAGWLYAATRNTAARAVRTEQRRQQRETEAMNRQLLEDNSPAAWEAVAPLLDEAMRELKPVEADAIVLRFFEGKSLRDTGAALALSENAAQKRVERALEKIREYFARRGVTASAALLGATIAANSVQAAPTGVAAGVAQTSLAGAAGAGGIFHLFWKAFFMSTKNKIIITLILAAAIAAIPVGIQQQRINRLAAELGKTTRAPAATAGKRAPATLDSLNALKSILAMKDPQQMMRALIDFVSGLDAASIPPLLDYLVRLPGTAFNSDMGGVILKIVGQNGARGQSSGNNQLALSLLINRLTHLNPQSALAWASAVPNRFGRTEVLGLVFTAWSNMDPASALAAANQIDDQRLREAMVGQIATNLITSNPAEALAALQSLPLNNAYRSIVAQAFADWGGTDPQAALAAAMNLPANRDRNAAIQSVVEGWAAVDPQAALAWAAKLPDGVTRNQAVNTAVRALVQQDPQQAVDYVAGISSIPSRNAMTIVLASDWAQDDPEAAAAWLQQNASGETLKQAIADIMDPLSKTDPQLAVNYLATMPAGGGDRMKSVTQISQNWAEQDPQADLIWLNALDNADGTRAVSAFKSGAEVNAVTTWAGSDPDAATAYVESLGVTDPQFGVMMAAVASSRAAMDPASAVTWLQSLPDDGTRSAALGSVVTQLISVDPQGALTLAMQMPAGTAQDTAVGKIISAWSTTDPTTAAQSLANLPAGAALTSATESVATNWIQADPAAAGQWVNSLPTGDARDVAVREEVKVLSGVDSPAAFNWAVSIGNVTMKSTQLRGVVEAWAGTDPTAAAAAVQSANITDLARTRLTTLINNFSKK